MTLTHFGIRSVWSLLGYCREHWELAGSWLGACWELAGNLLGAQREPAGSLAGACRKPAGTLLGVCREPAGSCWRACLTTFGRGCASCRRPKAVRGLVTRTTCSQPQKEKMCAITADPFHFVNWGKTVSSVMANDS